MRWLLILILVVTVVGHVLQLEFSLAPGLSIKNLLLYAGAGVLILRAFIARDLTSRYFGIQGAFVTLVGYAILTWLACAVVFRVDGYDIVSTGIALKSNFFDYLVFFLVFFYGVRDTRDATQVLYCLLAVVGLANLITITNVAGLTAIGEVAYGNDDDYEGGRIHGVFGHANETGTLIVLLLPLYIAAIETSVGWKRLAWYGLLGASLGMLLLTGSRGAVAGLLFGSVPAAYLLRRYLNKRRLTAWLIWFAVVVVPAMVFVGGKYLFNLISRTAAQAEGGASESSSGRTDLWAQALETMMDAPYSFVSGFGWGSWDLHGFIYVAHNTYLWILFELGIVGLIAFLSVWFGSIRVASRAARVRSSPASPYLVAYIVGAAAMLVNIMFDNLFTPWPYIWSLLGLMMRCAADADAVQTSQEVSRRPIGIKPAARNRELSGGLAPRS